MGSSPGSMLAPTLPSLGERRAIRLPPEGYFPIFYGVAQESNHFKKAFLQTRVPPNESRWGYRTALEICLPIP